MSARTETGADEGESTEGEGEERGDSSEVGRYRSELVVCEKSPQNLHWGRIEQ